MARFVNTLNTGSTELQAPRAIRRRRDSRFIDGLARTLPELTIDILFDEEHTGDWFLSHRNRMGDAAGVDGVQLKHMTHAAAMNASGQVIRAIRRDDFRPNQLRRVGILRPDGRVRTLHLATVAERIAFGAANERLTHRIAPLLGANFHYPVPGRGVHTLLQQVISQVEKTDPADGVFVCEMDIHRAFDNVNLPFLLDTLRVMGMQQALVDVLARILNPSEATGEIVGIPQGNPFSPIMFAAILHRVLSTDSNPQIAEGVLAPLVYADNLTYITHQEQVMEIAIQRHASQLVQTGLTFGTPTTTTDIRNGGIGTVVGNTIRMTDNQIRFEIPDDRMERAIETLKQLAVLANPNEAARTYLSGYVATKGHIYDTAGRDYCRQILARLRRETELGIQDENRILTRWEESGRQWRTNPRDRELDLNPVETNLSELLWEQDQGTHGQVTPW